MQLAGALRDPAPDLIDVAPSGNRMFVALRGPTPLSGDPHNATGSTPGPVSSSSPTTAAAVS